MSRRGPGQRRRTAKELWFDTIPCRTCRHAKRYHDVVYGIGNGVFCSGDAEPLQHCFCDSYVAGRSLRMQVAVTVAIALGGIVAAWVFASLFLVL